MNEGLPQQRFTEVRNALDPQGASEPVRKIPPPPVGRFPRPRKGLPPFLELLDNHRHCVGHLFEKISDHIAH